MKNDIWVVTDVRTGFQVGGDYDNYVDALALAWELNKEAGMNQYLAEKLLEEELI